MRSLCASSARWSAPPPVARARTRSIIRATEVCTTTSLTASLVLPCSPPSGRIHRGWSGLTGISLTPPLKPLSTKRKNSGSTCSLAPAITTQGDGEMVMRSRHDDDDETRDGYLDVVPPGGSVRVPAYLMDQRKFFDFNTFNRDHQPHFAAPLNDAAQHNTAAAPLEC